MSDDWDDIAEWWITTFAALPHHRGHEHLPSLLGVRWRRT
jgi:hypothetical protein